MQARIHELNILNSVNILSKFRKFNDVKCYRMHMKETIFAKNHHRNNINN